MTDQDVVHESRVSDLRHGLLTHPDVVERLLELAQLRRRWQTARSFWDGRVGGTAWEIQHERHVEYWVLLDRTARQLDGHFDPVDLDRFASVVRERLELGIWGKLVPVAHGGERYGREHQRVRTAAEATVIGTVESIVRQLHPERRHPNNGATAGQRRQWRARMRRLAAG